MKFLTGERLTNQLEGLVTDYAYNDKARYYPEPDLSTLDDAGQPVPTTNYEEVWCNWNDAIGRNRSQERWESIGDVGDITAEVRVKGFTPNKGAHFELIVRYNKDVMNPVKFEVVDIKQRGKFGYVCALKDVSI